MPEEDEALSTRKKVVAGAAIGVAIPAAVGAAKKLFDGGGHEERSEDQPQRSRRSASRGSSTKQPRARTASTARSTKKKTSSSRTASGREPTREELYRQATRLKVEGRSSMSKAELQRAVKRARSR